MEAHTLVTAADSPAPFEGSGPIPQTYVSTTGGAVVLTLPEDGQHQEHVIKVSLDTNAVTIRPSGAQRVNDGALGADFVLPSSTTGGSVRRWRVAFSGVAGLWIAQ